MAKLRAIQVVFAWGFLAQDAYGSPPTCQKASGNELKLAEIPWQMISPRNPLQERTIVRSNSWEISSGSPSGGLATLDRKPHSLLFFFKES